MDKSKCLNLTHFFLDEIALSINDNSYEREWYLDLEKEETIFTSGFFDSPKELLDAIKNDPDHERFVPIPRRTSRESWQQIERFILSLDDLEDAVFNSLQHAIRGQSAFTRFKEAIFKAGAEDRWFEFSGREDRVTVLKWLHSKGLIEEEEIKTGMQLYEKWIAKQKKTG